MLKDRVGVGVLVYLLLVCLSSVVTCMYLLWQGWTLPQWRGSEFVFLPFAAAWAVGAAVYCGLLIRRVWRPVGQRA